ncbi:MAG TPA: 6-pyruvoyl tetrahydropterin synthase family protein [Pirellulales bacterium]|nr:6-pyruvoyl tetrahydropterin synthase family protein [Pirellulales bacterium]
MPESYHVRLTKDYLVFSAAHFITFNGNVCERLHGHNYRVAAEVHGPLDENHYVVDFIALRDRLREIVAELDHHMLLPTTHPTIKVAAGEREVKVTFEDRRWVFPRFDCILLPVPNTTTELLAQYIGRRLFDELAATTGFRPRRLRIEVDECEGQVGVCELSGE